MKTNANVGDFVELHLTHKIWEGVLIYDPDRLARRYSYQELVMDSGYLKPEDIK
jgi:hypothetical protein